MRFDLYTRAILTVIALLLAVIAFRPYVSPDAVAHAQGSFAGVQYVGSCSACFFDTGTGDIWTYNTNGALLSRYRLTKLGQPLAMTR